MGADDGNVSGARRSRGYAAAVMIAHAALAKLEAQMEETASVAT